MPKNRRILEAQEVIRSCTFLHGSRSRTYSHRSSFISHVCTTNQVACVCLCVHLFFGAGPAQGVFFSGCCLLYQHISTIRAFGFVPCSGIDPSFRNEKMRKCRCVWHEKLACIARVFCRQICREAVCSLTTDIGDHRCIYV